MPSTHTDEIQSGKANFDDIYDAPDPEPYYAVLGDLDYQAPKHIAGLTRELIRERREATGRSDITVLDLCCSYGINAGLVNHDLTWSEIRGYYRSDLRSRLSAEERRAADRSFFGHLRHDDPVRFVGLDTAANAIEYGLDVGLLDDGFSDNLEDADPEPELEHALGGVDLVITSGGVGYVTERTIERIIDSSRGPARPWLAALVLRWIDFGSIEDALAARSFHTHKRPGTFHQRRFADADESKSVAKKLAELGRADDDFEADGYHHAELYISRR